MSQEIFPIGKLHFIKPDTRIGFDLSTVRQVDAQDGKFNVIGHTIVSADPKTELFTCRKSAGRQTLLILRVYGMADVTYAKKKPVVLYGGDYYVSHPSGKPVDLEKDKDELAEA